MKKRMIATLLVGAALVWGTGFSASAATPYASSAQKAQLQYMVEEEKMARDVYVALAAKTGSQRFANIARAEQTHMNEVSAVLKTYGIWDPTLTRSAGVFYNQNLGNLYTTLVAKGALSWNDAKAVGIQIEQVDIVDLAKMAQGVTQPDIQFMINALKAGSTNHLAAFKRF